MCWSRPWTIINLFYTLHINYTLAWIDCLFSKVQYQPGSKDINRYQLISTDINLCDTEGQCLLFYLWPRPTFYVRCHFVVLALSFLIWYSRPKSRKGLQLCSKMKSVRIELFDYKNKFSLKIKVIKMWKVLFFEKYSTFKIILLFNFICKKIIY